ncbi:hypothetical protein D9M68_1004450 [compost metagenome]
MQAALMEVRQRGLCVPKVLGSYRNITTASLLDMNNPSYGNGVVGTAHFRLACWSGSADVHVNS